MPDQRHQAARAWRTAAKARQSRPATIGMSTSPGRPPPPSANSTTGSRRRSASSNSRSFLCGCACPGCRPAPCSRRTSPRTGVRRRSRRRPPTRPSAGVRAISSSRERRRSCAANSSGPYSTKLPVVEQVVEVLARGAPAQLVAPGDRLGAGGVERRSRGVRARPRGRRGNRRRRPLWPPAGRPARVAATLAPSSAEHLALLDGVADRHLDAVEHAGRLGEHLVLHLHRLEHDQRCARHDACAGRVRDRHDDARERGLDRRLRGRVGRFVRRRHRRIIAQRQRRALGSRLVRA